MRLSWQQAVENYAGLVFLWQDLDGVHLRALPTQPPPTSILWGSGGDRLVRLRLDGSTVYAAEVDARSPEVSAVATAPWEADWGAVAQFRPDDTIELTQAFDMFVHRSDAGTPVTFLRPPSSDA